MLPSSSLAPLWQQVIAVIRRNVESGTWPPGTQIPSERELCDQYQISRTTVRQALNHAVTLGLLQRIQGKGTFVSPPKIRQPLFQITSFEATIRALGLAPGTTLLAMRQLPADVSTAHLLDLQPGSEVMRVRILGTGSGEPMALYDSVIPGGLAGPLQTEIDRRAALGQTFFVNELLAELNGWAFVNADQTYEVALPDGETARQFRLTSRIPCFRVTSLFQNPGGRRVEFRRAVYRGDQYQFHVTRQMDFVGREETR